MESDVVLELVMVLIAAILLQRANVGSFLGRVLTVVAIGVPAALWTNMSYLLWYQFPLSYTLSQIVIELAGFLAAGLVLSALLRPRLKLEI